MNKKIQVLQTYSKCSSEPEIIDQQNDVNYGIQNYDDDGMYETQYIGEQKNDEPVQYQQKKEKVEVQGLNFEKQSNPQCSEHLINNMIYDLDKSNIPKLDDLSKLKKMINDYEQIDSKIIDQLFDSMKTGLKNNDTTKLISDLKELLIQTRPLNIEGTNQLINRAEEAAYKVKDQEVILLMGQTGAGKSTTVYFLAGQKLKLDKIDIGKKQFVYNFTPDGQIINQDLQQINISYKGESETRYITPVKIEFDEDGFERTAIICDSPGFGDSAGAEVDIANGIGIIEAIKLCLSVRPVILVSQMMVGDRGDGLKKLTHLIVSMFKGNIQDYLPSFTYLYSKFPQETDINSFLQNIYNSIKNEEDDSSFQAIFKDMLKKSKKKQNSVIFDKINPLKEQDRNSILENILDKKPIKNPDDVFQYIITENSRSKLFEQTNLHEKCIQNALQNYHFDLVNHKMNQLKLIKDKLKLGQLETVYNQQVESIKKFISQQYNIKINEFNKILENQNDVQQNDIIKYQNFTKKIRSAEILKHNHISDLPCTSELYQNIVLQGNQLLKRLETIDVYDSKFITDFNNLYFLNQDFSDLKNIFKNALEQFDSYFESLNSQSIINFAQKKYIEVAESLNCIQQFIKIFDKKIDTSQKKQVYPKIIKQINDQTSSINDQCALIIQKERFEENELNKLIEYQQIFQTLSETHQIYDHISKELIQEASNKFYNYFLNYFEGILNQIKEIFQMDRDNNSIGQDLFKNIKSQLQKMETLRNQIKNLDHKSYKIYHYYLQITSSYVIEVRTKSIQLIDQLKIDPQNFDCQQLENILIKLKNSEWIDNHQDGLYSETIKQLDYQIKKQLQLWKDQLDELPLDLKNSQNIQQAYKIKQYSEKMKIFQVYFPAIEKIIQNISDRFNQAFQSNIDFIKNQFKPINQEELKNHLDIQTAELALIFLNNCKKQVSLMLNIQEAENILHEFLKNYKNESQNQMEIYLDYILNAEDDEKMINISDYSMRVYHRINNIQAMDGFKNLCEVIDTKDIIKKIINKLKHIFEDLMGKLQGTDVRDIQNYLTKTRTLSQFDEFIQNKTEKFFSLYQEFQNKNSQELKDDQKKLIEMIDKKQYEQFSYGVNDIGNINNKFKNQIKNNLQHSINEQSQYLNIKILMMNKDLNQKEINDIIQMLQYLKKAKQYIPIEYMDPQTSSDLDKNLTKFQDQITQKINDRIKQIENYLYYNGFLEAVELKEQFNDSVKLLVDCIQALDIQNQIQELDKKIDNMIVNQCKNQGNIKIEDYCNNPPKQLLEKLIEVIQKKSLYAQEYKKLEAKITNDIQKEINSIKLCNYEQKMIKIRDLEQAITYLPNILMEQLNKKIIEEKTKIRIKEFILSDYYTQSFEQDIQPKLLSKIKDQTKSSIDIIEQKDKQIDDRDFRKIRINLMNLMITYQKFSNEQEIKGGIEQIKDAIIRKIKKYMQQCNKKDINIAVQNLINIQTFIDEIPQVSKDIRIYMQQVLKRLKKECNPKEFSQIYILLEQDNGHGKSIIQEHESLFKGYQIQLFKSNTAKHNIDYIMKYIEGDQIDNSNFMKKLGKDPIDKGKLEKFYKKYEEKYQELIQKYITKQKNKADKQDDLIIKELANKVKSIPSKKFNQEDIQWNVQDEIIEIMAYIFTIWTFSNVQYYNEMDGVDQKQREDYLLQPHAGQIIAIFRILGIGYADGYFKTLIGLNESRLVNNLIQIGTGEGKSVTLAVTSCILALYDIDVYCACYSEYLSKRDYDSFSNLFEKLGLVERIHYGTFNKLCESVINDQFNIRQKVIDIIQQSGASDEQIKIQNRRKILLIDEVDVFFSEDFYGNIYAPLAKIKNPKIKKLTDYLWQNREGDLKMKQIENTLEYKELCQQFKGWENLIKEIVKSMKQDLQCFKHDYVVQNQKIGYKEQDQIVFNIVYGYKTMWAYYDEFQKNNVTQSVLEDNISIQIKCGAFSFAEIPKIFMNIMGVSGTLKTMSQVEKKIISDDYNIKIFTYMPSIFGQNQCEFNEKAGVKFWNKDDYFKEIKVEIKNNIGAKSNQRACLVFFETKEKLMKFYEYYQLDEQNIQYLTEESNSEEQSDIINKSTKAGSVTLFTKLFGRGIDFIVRDQNINSNRGMHVLQTFLSEEVSEETQIKGRTARQGQKGTFSMVLLNEDLEKYLGTKYLEELKEMQHNNNLYAKLNEKRNEYIHNKQKSINEMIQKIKKEHDDAISFKQNLLKKNIGDIQSFLLNQNRGEPEQIQSRTICLMDATGSMSSLLQKTKNTVGQMFQRAIEILKQHNLPQDCFQLQFLVYRDYDCKDGILQFSTWETKPDQLRTFMEKIVAKGGDDYEEAIEIGLFHCNKENEENSIDQIILIGDAPAKEQPAINRDREDNGGEDYWIKIGFPNTHYRKELEKLKQVNIPVHSFYLEKGAKSNFEEISRLTNGKSGQLKIDQESGSEQLTAVVTESILQSLPKGQELVESYRKKFGKAFA